MPGTKIATTDIIRSSHAELGVTEPFDSWSSQVISATERMLNVLLKQFPWYRLYEQRITAYYGGYWSLFGEGLAYVLAYAGHAGNDPDVHLVQAAQTFERELRGLFDNEVFTSSLDSLPIETLNLPALSTPNSLSAKAEAILALAPDQRGREILLDVAHGVSVASAGANQGIAKQTTHERIKRIRERAWKEITDA